MTTETAEAHATFDKLATKAEAELARLAGEMATMLATNPTSAIEWYSKPVTKAQAKATTLRMAARIVSGDAKDLRQPGVAPTIQGRLEAAAEWVARETRSLIRCRSWEHNSSCQFANASREAKAAGQLDAFDDLEMEFHDWRRNVRAE